MKTYELTYIASPLANQEELETMQKEVEQVIQSKEGAVLKLEKTGAKTLSYPIKKQISGYFTTITFQVSENNLKEIEQTVGHKSNILRHFIVIKKPQKEMKARMIRRSSFRPGVKKSVFSEGLEKVKKIIEKVEVKEVEVKEEEINKKLEEILSE